MTTVLPPASPAAPAGSLAGPGEPGPSPRGIPGRGVAESTAARRARLQMRRRLVTWSIPVVLVALVIAVKLLVMDAAAHRAVAGFYANSADAVHQAADTMAFANVVEQHKAPFARGDAWVVAGDFDQARAAFEQALELAPPDSVDSCQIRVNLALALEKLGDAAHQAGDEPTARQHWQRVVEVTGAAPPGCFDPPADGAGEKSRKAGQRAQAKLNPPSGQQPEGNGDRAPDQGKQDDLDKKTEENQRKRAEQGPDGQQQRPPGGGRLPPGAKPW